jgi:hypothetical protein
VIQYGGPGLARTACPLPRAAAGVAGEARMRVLTRRPVATMLVAICRIRGDCPSCTTRDAPALKAKEVSLYVMSAGLVAALTGVVVLAFNLSSLRADFMAVEERADEAEKETEEAERETAQALDDLEATERQLRNAKKSLRNALAASAAPSGSLAEQLANGSAVPTDGLSVSLPRKFWTCTDWKGDECYGLKDEAVFRNDTQIGSAVTCLFEVTYENGATTTFTWSSDYVPPGGGTDTQMIYFFSDYAYPIDLLGERDCYRGSAEYTSGIGD